MKKLFAVILVSLLLSAVVSCDGSTNDSADVADVYEAETADKSDISGEINVTENNTSDYVIVRSDLSLSSDEDVRAAIALKNAIKDATGVELQISSDWVDRGEEVPLGTREILIGQTNRPESENALEGLGEDEYIITTENGRIVINGTSKSAIALGVSVFVENMLGYNSDTGEYSMDSLKVPADYKEVGEYRFLIEARENAVVSVSPEKYAEPEYKYVDGIYEQSYGAWDLSGCLSTMQVASYYSDNVALNCDSVMLYSTSAPLVKSWTDKEDTYNIDMMIAINRADNEYALAHPEQVQTKKDGSLMIHGSGGSYYMVPTLDFIEYIWKNVEWSLINFRPSVIAFEEPEMWNASGYSQGFKDEWKLYFCEEWQDPESSPEALAKSMELKTYLFERIIIEMSERVKKIAPDTKIYIATHSTVNYNAWGITAGLNHFMATGRVEGVIGQTWSDTIRTAYTYQGVGTVDEFLNAYIDFASYVDSVEGNNFYALADPMADSTTATEEQNRYSYRQTIAASLMVPQIHRFELCPWVDRAFGKVSGSYRTTLQQCFNALNYVGGREITVQAGTPGIKYAVSDTISWLKNSAWSVPTSEGLYGVTMPLAAAGIPVGIKSMEQIYTAEDLRDTKILILSYDNQLPMSEDVNTAVAEWVKDGGVLLLTSGSNKYWEAADRFWINDGSPVKNLLNKLGLEDITVSTEISASSNAYINPVGGFATEKDSCKLNPKTRKFSVSFEGAENPILESDGDVLGFEADVGSGHVIAVGLTSNYYASSKAACELLLDLTKYASGYAGLEYCETNLMVTHRGKLTAAHALKNKDTLEGKYIDIFDDKLSVVTNPEIKAKDSAILWDISGYDLSVPRFGFSGGELMKDENGSYKLIETADKTEFSYTSAANSKVATRILAPKGTYPENVTAVSDGKEVTPITVWNNETSSLLLLIDGNAGGTEVTVTWGDTPVEDGQNVYYREESVITNSKNLDKEYLVENTAGVNDGCRFCDLDGVVVYKFDISKYDNPLFTLSISQNYIVEVSSDGESWTMIADYSQGGTVEHIKDGGNATILNITPYEYGITETFYFRIRNSNTSMGWGGSISRISWTYPISEEESRQEVAENDSTLPPVDDSAYVTSEANGVKTYKRTVKTNSSDSDSDYLLINTAPSNDSIRFCDGAGQVVYYFDLRGTSGFRIDMNIYQNYIVEVSSDGSEWTEVADYSEGGTKEHITTGNNRKTITVKSDDYGYNEDFYVRLSNTDISQGWGGSISQFTVSYTRP